MQVTLMRATDLKPSRLKSLPAESRDTEQCMCFVEMLALGRSYVGPIAPQSNSPEWDWTFFLPVDSEPTEAGGVVARFTVHNFMARKQPQVARSACHQPYCFFGTPVSGQRVRTDHGGSPASRVIFRARPQGYPLE